MVGGAYRWAAERIGYHRSTFETVWGGDGGRRRDREWIGVVTFRAERLEGGWAVPLRPQENRKRCLGRCDSGGIVAELKARALGRKADDKGAMRVTWAAPVDDWSLDART